MNLFKIQNQWHTTNRLIEALQEMAAAIGQNHITALSSVQEGTWSKIACMFIQLPHHVAPHILYYPDLLSQKNNKKNP